MTVTPRVLKQASKELVYAKVTDETGQDITGDTFQISHVVDATGVGPGTWEAPDATFSGQGETVAVRRLAKLVTGVVVGGKRTRYRVFVRVVDNPEDTIIDCGTYTVMP